MKTALQKKFKVLLVYAGLVAHTWQKEELPVARAGLDILGPSIVAVTDQGIGIFIPALVEVCVTSH